MDFNADPFGGADKFGGANIDGHHVSLGMWGGVSHSDGEVMEVVGAQIDLEG